MEPEHIRITIPMINIASREHAYITMTACILNIPEILRPRKSPLRYHRHLPWQLKVSPSTPQPPHQHPVVLPQTSHHHHHHQTERPARTARRRQWQAAQTPGTMKLATVLTVRSSTWTEHCSTCTWVYTTSTTPGSATSVDWCVLEGWSSTLMSCTIDDRRGKDK